MIEDTIFATASPAGAAERGLIRLSGPEALAAASALLPRPLEPTRAVVESSVSVLGFDVRCLVLVMPGPRSYTGEDVVELHLPGSPMLLETVQATLSKVARSATPGEFTRRAYEQGRIDLPTAEGVGVLIHAAGDEARRRAAFLASGAFSTAVTRIRDRIRDAHALIEAGLDFDEDETGAVPAEQWRPALDEARREAEAVLVELPRSEGGGEWLLLGVANAGKSSLCNALAGHEVVLASEELGTTRDVLAVDVAPGIRVLDAPGHLAAPEGLDRAALALREEQLGRAGGVLVVVDATDPVVPALPANAVAVVWTKVDRAAATPEVGTELPAFRTSSVTGEGLPALRAFLGERATGHRAAGGTRLAAEVRGTLAALDRARAASADGALPELVAEELLMAVEHLDRVVGESSPEDLLDRIFEGFCLGK